MLDYSELSFLPTYPLLATIHPYPMLYYNSLTPKVLIATYTGIPHLALLIGSRKTGH
jgi:hypothetical protein